FIEAGWFARNAITAEPRQSLGKIHDQFAAWHLPGRKHGDPVQLCVVVGFCTVSSVRMTVENFANPSCTRAWHSCNDYKFIHDWSPDSGSALSLICLCF